MNFIFLSACLVLTVVPVVFVTHRVYEDGVVGRASLLGISFFASMFVGSDVVAFFGDGDHYEVLPLTAALAASFATFLCWHLWRFHRRVLRKRHVFGERQAG